jgi:hypothetical protein
MVDNATKEKQQLFIFIDHCLAFIAMLMVQVFLMHFDANSSWLQK